MIQPGRLQERTFGSSLIVFGTSLVTRAINLLSLVVLARLLTPQDFGMFGLALVVINAMNLFSQAGLAGAVVQTQRDPRRAACMAFAITMPVGIVLSVIVIAIRSPLARLLGNPEIAPLIGWMTLLLLLEVAAAIPNALLMRNLAFGRRSAAFLAESVAMVVSAISAALLGAGVWSLVIGHLVGLAVRTVTMAKLSPERGWWKAGISDLGLARDLLRFGVPSMSAGLVRQLYTNGDDLIVGRFIGAAGLGLYSQAYKIAHLPLFDVTHVVNSVMFPSFAAMQTDPDRVARAFLKALRAVSLLTVPMALGTLVLAPEIVLVVLGPRWEGVIGPLRIFAIVGLFRPLSATTGPLFNGLGLPGLNLRTASLQAVISIPLALVLLPLGITGVAWAVSLTFFAGFIHNIHLAAHRTGIPLDASKIVRAVVRIAAGAAVMAGAVTIARGTLQGSGLDTSTVPALLGLILFGAAVYAGIILVLEPELVRQLGRLVAARLRPKRMTDVRRSVRSATADGILATDRAAAQQLADARFGRGAIDRLSFEHLSGWKTSGAYRMVASCHDGREWSAILKVSTTAERDAFEGVPAEPGPPELTVYRSEGALVAHLPEIYEATEAAPHRYRYLLEDLAPGWTRPTDDEHLLTVSAALPVIHGRLSDALSHDPGLLRFDTDYAISLLEYARISLSALDPRRWPEGTADLMTDWAGFETRYVRDMEMAHDAFELQPVHGDLNPSNVWLDRQGSGNVKLVDWEWAGHGLPHADLAALLKHAGPELEDVALGRFPGGSDHPGGRRTYRWCKIQRHLLDAAFFARRMQGATTGTSVDPRRHLRASLHRLLEVTRSTV